MPLIYNGNSPKNITYNGNEVKKVIYNGNTVWEKNEEMPLDMVAWYKASTINLSSGSLVTEWVDSSSNNYNATANGKIYYKESGINNKPCVTLNKASYFTTDIQSYVDERTIFVVSTITTNTKNPSIISADGTRGVWYGVATTTGKIQGGIIGVKSFFSSDDRTDIAINTTAIRTYCFKPGEQKGYLNGVLEDVGTNTDYGNLTRKLVIGKNTYNVFAGDIYEIIIYDRILSDNEIDVVNSYLSDAYNV